MSAVGACLAVGAFYAVAYRLVVARWGRVAHAVVARTGMESRHPAREVEAISKLVGATLAQLAFAAVLVAAVWPVAPLRVGASDLPLLPLAVALGAAEIGLASFACTVLVRAIAAPGGERQLLAQGRRGWMGQFLAITQATPARLAIPTVVLYVAVEEVVFRAVVIGVMRDAGVVPALAVAVSAALYVAAQRVNMPSWRAALFPLAGAVVIGVVHGILFWRVPRILPLAVAHATFIVGALALARAMAGVRR